jgi:hypothetical protein
VAIQTNNHPLWEVSSIPVSLQALEKGESIPFRSTKSNTNHPIMPLVSVTRLRLRKLRFLPGFAWLAVRSSLQAKRTEGNLRTMTIKDRGLIFWTIMFGLLLDSTQQR